MTTVLHTLNNQHFVTLVTHFLLALGSDLLRLPAMVGLLVVAAIGAVVTLGLRECAPRRSKVFLIYLQLLDF